MKQYISHQVAEISRITKREQWQHCPGSINPADIPSRRMSGRKLAVNETWWTGPPFLKRSECQWPRTDPLPPNEATKAEEIKRSTDVTHVSLSTEKGEVCRIRLPYK